MILEKCPKNKKKYSIRFSALLRHVYLTAAAFSAPEAMGVAVAVVVTTRLPHSKNCQECVEVLRGRGVLGVGLGRGVGGEELFYRLYANVSKYQHPER